MSGFARAGAATARHAARIAREYRPDLSTLEGVQAVYAQAQEQAELARLARNEEIARALADGVSQSHVARITGLSRWRIQQLLAEIRRGEGEEL